MKSPQCSRGSRRMDMREPEQLSTEEFKEAFPPSLLEEVISPDRVPMKKQADRYNTGKPELSFLMDAPLAMQGLANRFSLGARKYSRDNWKLGLPTKQVIDSLLRHIMAYSNGELTDEDGGEHVDAIVWNAVVLSEQSKRGMVF